MSGSDSIFDVIEAIAGTSSKNEKIAMVTNAIADPDFKRVCEYAYNPFKTYGVAKRPALICDNLNNQFDDGTWELLDDLISRKLTGNAAIDAIRGEMTALSEESSELFWRIIKKDLRADFSEATINKASKGLIPEFPYMRCSLPKEAKLADWPWSVGVPSQEKADGMFANVDHEESGMVSIRSRQGSEFPIEKFPGVVKDVQERLTAGCQYHGEFEVHRDGAILPRQIGNGILNSVANGGDFGPGEKPVYKVWDQIPLTSVTSKGKYIVPYMRRLTSIIKQLREKPGDSVVLIATKIVRTQAEAYAHAAELMKIGKEGTVVKHPEAIWKDGKSKEQVKIKLEFEVDLEIVSIAEGKADSKNEGRAGAFMCRSSCGMLLVDVTVKNEALRDLVDASPSDFIGRIIPVTANDITLPSESNEFHSLFLPRMTEASYRTDKNVADDLERIFAQKEAAIFGESLLKEAA